MKFSRRQLLIVVITTSIDEQAREKFTANVATLLIPRRGHKDHHKEGKERKVWQIFIGMH